MEIDLNDPSELTIDNVRKLIASKDDSQNRQLRVFQSGIAFVSDDVGNKNIGDLSFRFETWGEGNGYCGSVAAADDIYVKQYFMQLKKNWPSPTASYIDWI